MLAVGARGRPPQQLGQSREWKRVVVRAGLVGEAQELAPRPHRQDLVAGWQGPTHAPCPRSAQSLGRVIVTVHACRAARTDVKVVLGPRGRLPEMAIVLQRNLLDADDSVARTRRCMSTNPCRQPGGHSNATVTYVLLVGRATFKSR